MDIEAARLLAEQWLRYNESNLPRPTKDSGVDEEAVASLYHEDAYLVGLVETFLRVRSVTDSQAQDLRNRHQLRSIQAGDEPSLGQLNVDSIRLDRMIDARLEAAQAASDTGRAVLATWLEHRQRMVELATALSQASGIPLVWWERQQTEEWLP